MAGQTIMIDTSILLDYYRKTDKENSVWIRLIREGFRFAISSVTKYELYSGATSLQVSFWDDVLKSLEVISLDEASVDIAVEINAVLKKNRKQIDLADLFIAATAVSNGLPIATLNKKHFERVDKIEIII